MWKMLGLLVVGLAVGAGVILYSHHDSGSKSLLVTAEDSQNVDVQKSLAALDRRVRELSAQVQALQASSGRPGAPGAIANPGRPQDFRQNRQQLTPEQTAAMEERRKEFEKERQEQEAQRIKAAGLTPERVQAISRRAEELRVAAMQAQFEAQAKGQRIDNVNTNQALRKELGDAEYERYLKATGRPTEVGVSDVLASSAAERAGLKAGDQIVSYAGKRVYENQDLNTLTNQGTPGTNVVVEVNRNGQTIQVTVPSGPLGVTTGGGGRGGRGGGGGGGPGGFGGPGGPPGGGGFGGPGGGPGGFRGGQ